MFSNILGGAAGFPVADLGDEINRSIRFNNNHWLHNTGLTIQGTSTMSMWVKLTGADRVNRAQLFGSGAGNPGEALAYGNTTTQQNIFISRNPTTQNPGGAPYDDATRRDYSAWYHCVVQFDSSLVTTLFVNGVQQSNTREAITTTGGIVLGNNSSSSVDEAFCGYMGEVYYVDGQILAPTNFARTNEDGVWVPKNYTGSYGTNGFHLDFADSSDLGNDVSGNNNDFTASGFDTGAVALYSPDTVSSTGSWYASSTTAAAAFDGSTSNFAQTNTSSTSQITFTPSTPIPYTSSVEVYLLGNQASINGGSYQTVTASQYNTIASGSGTITSISTQGSYGGTLGAIRVDGTILVDNTDNDVDYNDTPTSNYPTINVLSKGTNTSKVDTANMRFASTGSDTPCVLSTIQPTGGKFYAEFHHTSWSNSGNEAGLFLVPQGFTTAQYAWNEGFGIILALSGVGRYREFTSNNTTSSTPTFTDDPTLQIAVDFDTGAVSMGFNNNWLVGGSSSSGGTWQNTFGVTRTYTTQDLANFVIAAQGYGAYNLHINYGQHPFLYTPPTGFDTHIQTNNLPEPTIKNGKEHFDVVTYSGNGSTQNITGLEFQPDFVWLKEREYGYHHRLFDVIRGQSCLVSNDNRAAGSSSSSSLTSFNSDGFSLTQTANEAYNESGTNYVAWCWKAGGTAVSNSDGTEASTVSANTDAGFSIVQWTPDDAAGTVGHGLDTAPECIFLKGLDSSAWYVYHASAGATHYSSLSANIEFAASSAVWDNTAPTSSVFSVGSVGNADRGGAAAIAFCWHSVEGYSKIGKYVGNSSSDGPFVYTGFDIGWLMIKYSSTKNWLIYDSTRQENNPDDKALFANLSDEEGSGTYYIDKLSNGFKIRTSDSNLNYTGADYYYMAFARNPFGGENAPPVTAR